MKNNIKKIIIIIGLIVSCVCFTSCKSEMVGMANPWIDNTDYKTAFKKAGFSFPLKLSNYSVRAMKGMIEISYPLDEKRTVYVRKSDTNETGDISGVYTKYPINKEIVLKGAVPMQIRADKDKIYVMNMAAESGYYSAYCPEGMSLKEIEGIYEILAEAEAPKGDEF